MCGIFGLVLNTNAGANYKDMEAVETLLYFDALRGKDSTGIGLFDTEAGIRLTKDAVDASEFLKTKEWASIRAQFLNNGKSMLGHNRKKTIGAIKDETAHPFLIDNRHLFMHNGTLFSHKHLADTEVDSEALGIHLTKCLGNVNKLETALEQVHGAYACSWIDKEKEILYLLRNKERPLWYGESEIGWVFCSEPGIMRLAFIRAGLKFDEAKEVPVDTLVSFDLTEAKPLPIMENLTVKKSWAPTIQQANAYWTSPENGGNTILPETTENPGVSKNGYKRLTKRGLVGKDLSFKLVDFVEKTPNDPLCTDWYLMGESIQLDFPHCIHAPIKGASREDMWDVYSDVLWEGVVTSMDYNRKLKQVDIYMKSAATNFKPLVH